jgi:hypothetical protein
MCAHLQILLHGKMLKHATSFNHLNDTHLGNLFRAHFVDALIHELNRPVGNLAVFVL